MGGFCRPVGVNSLEGGEVFVGLSVETERVS